MAGIDEDRPRERFFGREAEQRVLTAVLEDAGPAVASVTGLPGIGKSALLRQLARRGAERGVAVRLLDCRTVEPTRGAFRAALEELGVGGGPGREVLCLDHYEHFQLLDAWLRGSFLREVGPRLGLVIASRHALGVGWAATGLPLASLRLGVLDEDAAQALLGAHGVRGEPARGIQRIAKGHPLALVLAASTRYAGTEEDLGGHEVVHRLTRYFLEQVDSQEVRTALEACAVVRRVTRPILASLLQRSDVDALYEHLASLPLTDLRADGLGLHPTVHEAVSAWLRAADPARFTRYRRRAWEVLQREGASIGRSDLWRYTADVIYLIDDPVVREAFFPTGTRAHVVEPARAEDTSAIASITAAHADATERAALTHWREVAPSAFHVVRDRAGDVQGFYVLLDPAGIDGAALAADPVAREWAVDVPGDLRAGHRRVLFLRRWLAREAGDAPSAIQAACWLDVKRAYLEGRPLLQRVYLAVNDLAPYTEAAAKLGFRPVCSGAGLRLASAMLEFGRGSVDAWLGRLVREDLGLDDEIRLDEAGHALDVGGASVPLTPREMDVARLLLGARGAVVARDDLLRGAWEGGHAIGSNVVDVLIRGLRRKLGSRAGAIETVRGVGYRWGA